jgi:hypothetical protein
MELRMQPWDDNNDCYLSQTTVRDRAYYSVREHERWEVRVYVVKDAGTSVYDLTDQEFADKAEIDGTVFTMDGFIKEVQLYTGITDKDAVRWILTTKNT